MEAHTSRETPLSKAQAKRRIELDAVIRKIWSCDFTGCDEPAHWYRKSKGRIVKVCTKHEAMLARQHWGRRIEYSELGENDIRCLESKTYWAEYEKEYEKEHPFEVLLFHSGNEQRVTVRDLQTKEQQSFVFKDTELGKFFEAHTKLEREGFVPKPSIDDYVRKLRCGVN